MFYENLKFGKAGESAIAQWLRARGNYVLPVYEKEGNEFKGPVLYRPDGTQLICPDLPPASTFAQFGLIYRSG